MDQKEERKWLTSKTYFRLKTVCALKDMFRISVSDYEFFLNYISDFISPNERINGNRYIIADEDRH